MDAAMLQMLVGADIARDDIRSEDLPETEPRGDANQMGWRSLSLPALLQELLAWKRFLGPTREAGPGTHDQHRQIRISNWR